MAWLCVPFGDGNDEDDDDDEDDEEEDDDDDDDEGSAWWADGAESGPRGGECWEALVRVFDCDANLALLRSDMQTIHFLPRFSNATE